MADFIAPGFNPVKKEAKGHCSSRYRYAHRDKQDMRYSDITKVCPEEVYGVNGFIILIPTPSSIKMMNMAL